MSLVNINWKPDRTELRKYGVAMLIGFAIIGSLFFYFGKTEIAYGAYIFGAIAGLSGLSGLRPLAMPIYLLWMFIAFIMGNIISRIIMLVIFFLILFPISIFLKVIGKDKLLLKNNSKTDTHWQDIKPDNKKYTMQF